jgi:hypothetical protein
MTLSRRGVWIWIGLVVVDVAIWVIAEFQSNDSLFEALWVITLFGFILLVVFGVVALVRAVVRARRHPAS